MKHTPGPWKINGWSNELIEAGPKVIADTDPYTKFGTHHEGSLWKSNKSEAIANTQLIAAAPELLEALERLTEQVWQSCPIGSDSKLLELFKRFQEAQAAIKKATS